MNEPCYYRVSVKAIAIDDQGRILLAREDNGLWELMGGGLDHGEDPIACLKREIHEETGLEVVEISQQPRYFLTSKRYNRNDYLANIIYVVKLKNLDFTPSSECQELRYFSISDMEQAKLFPNVQALLAILKEENRGHDKIVV